VLEGFIHIVRAEAVLETLSPALTEEQFMAAPTADAPIARQTITIKLRLRDKHAAELNRQARAVNFVWNYCNELSGKAWRDHRRWLSKFELSGYTAFSSQELDLHGHTIQRVCHAFAQARDLKKRAQIRWRGRKSLGWVPFNSGKVTFDGAQLKFRGVKYCPMHFSQRLTAGIKIGAGSFNRDGRGRWYVNLPVEIEATERASSDVVGIDLGLKSLVTLSDGETILAPRFYRASEESHATAQRAKKTKRARNIARNVANRRKDFLHKASRRIVDKHGTIVVGGVSVKRIAKTNMAKSVKDASWSTLKKMLSYKALMHGGRMIEVNEAYTSQSCHCCGSLPHSRPKGIAGLRIREWTCDDCGTVHDRDVNAARNILRIGLDTLVEGAARECRSSHEAKPDAGIAFPGGNGTANMVKLMEEAGMPVWKVQG